MDIVEYDDVNPLAVLDLNLTSLGYPLTPERVVKIRQMDPRPLPFFALYAVIDGTVAGQVGVFRLPVVTTEGEEEIGGLWAVNTHPSFRRRGIASALSREAHARMQQAGLRFSSLGTNRYLVSHTLYRKHGYVDAHISGSTLAHYEDVDDQGDLRATQADVAQWPVVDDLFDHIARSYLGFARRHPSFIAMMVAADGISGDDVWLIERQNEQVGYVLARRTDTVLSVYSLLLESDVDTAKAIAAVANQMDVSFVRVRVEDEKVGANLHRAGYPPVHDSWFVFMIKSLVPELPQDTAGRLLGIDSQRFLISQIDLT